jgi:pimeloyl-ACP methyl ester carboxylesterase
METVKIDGVELAYRTVGSGETVVFLHCGFIAEAFAPLFGQSGLASRFRLLNYHRRGYGQSGPVTPPFSIAQQAQDLIALLDALGIERASLAGHSFGANVALQAALMYPDRVHALALIEPPIPFLMLPDSAQVILGVMGMAMGLFGRGDRQGALDAWLDGAFGPGWQAVVRAAIPGAYEQAVKDVDTALIVEAASLQTWELGPDDIRTLKTPVLSAFHVDPVWNGFQEVHQGLVELVPQAESLVVPNATHLMQIQNPHSVAEGLAAFLLRQEMKEKA